MFDPAKRFGIRPDDPEDYFAREGRTLKAAVINQCCLNGGVQREVLLRAMALPAVSRRTALRRLGLDPRIGDCMQKVYDAAQELAELYVDLDAVMPRRSDDEKGEV